MKQPRSNVIRMTPDGGFEIVSNRVSTELGYDPQCDADPWCVNVIDASGRCLHSESVPTLDIGLDRLSDLGNATLVGLRGLYRVELPGGVSFQRPGDVPAEDILRKYGYDLVASVRTFLVAPLDAAMSREDAGIWFGTRLGVLAPLLGNVDMVESDGSDICWCADVLLPVNGFYGADGLLAFAKSAVGACGIEMFSEISVRSESPPPTKSGDVVDFAARAARI